MVGNLQNEIIKFLKMSQNKNHFSIIDNEAELLKVNLNLNQYYSYNRPYHSENLVRKLLREDFDVFATYVFLSTRANVKAIKILDASSKFTSKHMSNYLVALRKIVSKKLWYKCFSLIKSECHSLERDVHFPQATWPIRHIIKADRKGTAWFMQQIVSLHNDETFEIIKQKEAPQNYQLEGHKILHKYKISPLIVEDRVWRVNGSELKNAVDFLLQDKYKIFR